MYGLPLDLGFSMRKRRTFSWPLCFPSVFSADRVQEPNVREKQKQRSYDRSFYLYLQVPSVGLMYIFASLPTLVNNWPCYAYAIRSLGTQILCQKYCQCEILAEVKLSRRFMMSYTRRRRSSQRYVRMSSDGMMFVFIERRTGLILGKIVKKYIDGFLSM